MFNVHFSLSCIVYVNLTVKSGRGGNASIKIPKKKFSFFLLLMNNRQNTIKLEDFKFLVIDCVVFDEITMRPLPPELIRLAL